MGSVVAFGYRMNDRGRVVHRLFDLHDLQHGEAARNGWLDSPDKVPGFAKAEADKASHLAAHARTTGREPKATGVVYGDTAKEPPIETAGNRRKSPNRQNTEKTAETIRLSKPPETAGAPSVLRNAAGRAVNAIGRYVKA